MSLVQAPVYSPMVSFFLIAGSLSFLACFVVVYPDQVLSARTIGVTLLALNAMVAWFFQRSQKTKTAAFLLIVGTWTYVTVVSYFTGGLRATPILIYPPIIMLAGWRFGPRAAGLMAALTVVACAVLFRLQSTGALPVSPPTPPALLLTVQVFIFLFSAYLASRLFRAYQDQLSALTERSLALESSQKELTRAQAVGQIGSWIYQFDSDRFRLSAQACRIFGLPADSEESAARFFTHPCAQHRHEVEAAWQQARQGAPFDVVHQIQVGDEIRWVRQTAEIDFSTEGVARSAVGVTQDITERMQAQSALEQSLKDKEALLKEVHHRVKNNLQVVASLLNLERRRSPHQDTKAVLGDMQGRIRSMALLHESLYRSGTFASVDLGTYLTQLATQAFRSQSGCEGMVRLELDMASVPVGMDQAIPCGLLVNELISNCLKHGFPQEHAGRVKVQLQAASPDNPTSDTLWRLCVSDNGVGLPADFETRSQTSLGLQLVHDLSRQIDGTLTIHSPPGAGAEFTVVFKVLEPEKLVLPR